MAKPVRIKGVDEELQKILDANMDEAPTRRRAREAFKDIQIGIDHILFKVVAFQLHSSNLYIKFFFFFGYQSYILS